VVCVRDVEGIDGVEVVGVDVGSVDADSVDVDAIDVDAIDVGAVDVDGMGATPRAGINGGTESRSSAEAACWSLVNDSGAGPSGASIRKPTDILFWCCAVGVVDARPLVCRGADVLPVELRPAGPLEASAGTTGATLSADELDRPTTVPGVVVAVLVGGVGWGFMARVSKTRPAR
jgi:hypothetical protein